MACKLNWFLEDNRKQYAKKPYAYKSLPDYKPVATGERYERARAVVDTENNPFAVPASKTQP